MSFSTDAKKSADHEGEGQKHGKDQDHDEDEYSDTSPDHDSLDEDEAGETVANAKELQVAREKLLVEGLANVPTAEEQFQSPDDVTIIVTKEAGKGNKVQILVQLEETKTSLKMLGESFSFAFAESKKKKYTFIYIIALVIGVVFFSHVTYKTASDGILPTADSSSAVFRFFVSVGFMIIISPMAFFIINLRVSSIGLGLFWMFMIVSVQYFTSTSLSSAAHYMYVYHRSAKDSQQPPQDKPQKHYGAMKVVYEYVTLHYYGHSKKVEVRRELFFMKRLALEYNCCDYDFFNHVNGSKSTSTLYDAVFSKSTDKSDKEYRPKSCCPKKPHCKKIDAIKKKCNRELLLNRIYDVMIIILCYTLVMLVLCVLMAFVFWYYYSGLKARETSVGDQPGDFALLNLNPSNLDGQGIELTFREKLQRQKKRRKLSKLRQKYGMGELSGENIGDQEPVVEHKVQQKHHHEVASGESEQISAQVKQGEKPETPQEPTKVERLSEGGMPISSNRVSPVLESTMESKPAPNIHRTSPSPSKKRVKKMEVRKKPGGKGSKSSSKSSKKSKKKKKKK